VNRNDASLLPDLRRLRRLRAALKRTRPTGRDDVALLVVETQSVFDRRGDLVEPVRNPENSGEDDEGVRAQIDVVDAFCDRDGLSREAFAFADASLAGKRPPSCRAPEDLREVVVERCAGAASTKTSPPGFREKNPVSSLDEADYKAQNRL
jgi:hypothetical protein